MSNLSELLPAGAGAKSAEFVASGTLASGQTVALKSDGAVEAISATSVSESLGTATTFVTELSNRNTATVFDSVNNKIVVVYVDPTNSYYATARVGTISGSTISFGTAVVFDSSGASTYITATFDSSAGKIVVSYRNPFAVSKALVGTVSGTSISFGSSTTYTEPSLFTNITFDSTNNKVVIVGRDTSNSEYGTAVVGTVSGTSISFGSKVVYNSATSNYNIASFASGSGQIIVAYQNDGLSGRPSAILGTVSGTSISFGSSTIVEEVNANYVQVQYDPSTDKAIVMYQYGSTNGRAAVGTISGNSISFGTPVTVGTNGFGRHNWTTFDTNLNQIISVALLYNTYPYPTVVTSGKVSGDTISFSTLLTVTSQAYNTGNLSAGFDSNLNKAVLVYGDGAASDAGKAVVYQAGGTLTNSADFIGITDQAIADTATGAVIVQGGVSEKLSGLTVGADYYVQADGSLAGSAGIPYDISSASLSTSFSISAQQTLPTGLAFSSDGTKMFTCGELNSDVDEYTLSTAYDVSTASYSQNFSIAGQETEPTGLAFNTDGTKMFVLGNAGNDVNEYALSTGFDVSTASFSQSFSISAQEATPHGIAFNTDGTKMFIVGRAGVDVNEYDLSTGFDVSTASYSQNFSVSSQEADPLGIAFNSDGTKMFITGDSNNAVFQYNLSTGFDVSTASYASITFSLTDTNPNDIAFSADGDKMFIIGASGDSVYQYSTTPASTTVPAGRALSTTSILLEG